MAVSPEGLFSDGEEEDIAANELSSPYVEHTERKEHMHYVRHDEEEAVTRYVDCWGVDSERKFLLYRENPIVMSLLSGGGVYLFLEQFFKLWPEERARLQLAFSSISAASAVVGLSMGTLSLSYHNADKVFKYFRWNGEQAAINFARTKRLWISIIEGFGSLAPFILGESILRYCADPNHWNSDDQCMVSNQYLLRNFLPAPLIVATIYTVWNCIFPSQKEAWAATGRLQKIGVYTLECGFNALLHSRYIQALCQALAMVYAKASITTAISRTPNPAYYEIPACAGAALAIFMLLLKPQHAQKVLTVMMYVSILVMTLTISVDTYREYATPQGPDGTSLLPAAIVNTLSLGMCLIGGGALTSKFGGTSFREIRIISTLVEAGYPSLLRSQWDLESGENVTNLRKCIEEERVLEAKEKAELIQKNEALQKEIERLNREKQDREDRFSAEMEDVSLDEYKISPRSASPSFSDSSVSNIPFLDSQLRDSIYSPAPVLHAYAYANAKPARLEYASDTYPSPVAYGQEQAAGARYG